MCFYHVLFATGLPSLVPVTKGTVVLDPINAEAGPAPGSPVAVPKPVPLPLPDPGPLNHQESLFWGTLLHKVPQREDLDLEKALYECSPFTMSYRQPTQTQTQFFHLLPLTSSLMFTIS